MTCKASDLKIIFVGGSPRSGTTLVKRILDAHSDIYCGPEFDYLPRFCELYSNMKYSLEIGRLKSYTDEHQLREHFRNFILAFFVPLAERFKVHCIAEKTPDNIIWFYELHEIFPEAFLVHVIRNPLDVVASHLRLGKRTDRNQPLFHSARLTANVWKKTVFHLTRDNDRFNDPEFRQKYLELRYEDLVRRPGEEIARLSDHIGVPFEKSMLVSSGRGKGDITIFDEFYTTEEYYRPIVQSSVGRWKKELSKRELFAILDITYRELIELGYYTYEDIQRMKSCPVLDISCWYAKMTNLGLFQKLVQKAKTNPRARRIMEKLLAFSRAC
ncbi:MAG TPA: sulfotransferase [Thermodesulfobacteriaceae bacterium]|nr:sulfotransferase [Thermodesulfobacteriaceae bacterium]